MKDRNSIIQVNYHTGENQTQTRFINWNHIQHCEPNRPVHGSGGENLTDLTFTYIGGGQETLHNVDLTQFQQQLETNLGFQALPMTLGASGARGYKS